MRKKFYVKVAYDHALRFPGWCPFSGKQNPEERVIVSTRKTLMFLPFGTHLMERYRSASISVSASARTARTVFCLKLANFIILLSGIAGGFLLLNGDQFKLIGMLCLCAILVGICFFGLRLVLRPVRITYLGHDFMDVCFTSEQYAREFCALNGLTYEARIFKLRLV